MYQTLTIMAVLALGIAAGGSTYGALVIRSRLMRDAVKYAGSLVLSLVLAGILIADMAVMLKLVKMCFASDVALLLLVMLWIIPMIACLVVAGFQGLIEY